MKSPFTLALFLFLSFTALHAQDDTLRRNKVDDDVVKIVNKARDRVVFELGFNQLINTPDSVQIRWHSRHFNLYFMYDVVLGKSPISIAPGVGVGTDNYYIRNMIYSDTAQTHFVPLDKGLYDYKKNKFGLIYIDFPIELRFRSKPNLKGTSWKLAAGFKLGLQVGDKWKYKGLDPRGGTPGVPGEEVKFKEFKIDNIELLRYGVTLRGGYGPVSLYVQYYFSDIFKEGRGPSGNPILFGLSINGL